MFDKLVVSTAQRRRGRTAKFFLGTVLVYLSTVAIAFALSIFLATPKLADTRSAIFVAPLPAPRTPSVVVDLVVDPGNNGGVPPQDLNNLRRLEDMLDHTQTNPPRIAVPAGTIIRQGDGVVGGDPNAPPTSVGFIGGELRTTELPPRPPDPPKPQARTREEDNRPVRVTSVVLQGKAIERRTPIYPPLARQIHLQGDVSVEVIISPDGRVESARVVSGHPMFAQYAREAALGWRFEPTLLNNVAVRVTGVITFAFKLSE
ncbi:MAG TPA: energy transducer TonB [Blastocatellia bacterium]|nr:energy transducer TonB [Blastocatellia bacterium]